MTYEPLIHRDAEFEIEKYSNRISLKLINKITKEFSVREYYFIEEGITLKEITKIDIIIQFLHQDIGLDYFDNEKLLIIDNKK